MTLEWAHLPFGVSSMDFASPGLSGMTQSSVLLRTPITLVLSCQAVAGGFVWHWLL